MRREEVKVNLTVAFLTKEGCPTLIAKAVPPSQSEFLSFDFRAIGQRYSSIAALAKRSALPCRVSRPGL